MRIVIPMAGAGSRFIQKGYKVHKPAIPTYDRHTGQLLPMVVCAVRDLPGVERDGENVIFIDREFHQTDGVEEEIRHYFPGAQFITVKELTQGQACTCLLAQRLWDREESLLIAACDNGMDIDREKFARMTSAGDVDELVFTYRHNEAVLRNPEAYGWMQVDGDRDKEDVITGVSVKKAISDTPCEDHAVAATFWFRTAEVFRRAAEKMIAENDRINDEFYVDEVVKHVMELGGRAKVFEMERYVGWGTPEDYENYQNTYRYWTEFLKNEAVIST